MGPRDSSQSYGVALTASGNQLVRWAVQLEFKRPRGRLGVPYSILGRRLPKARIRDFLLTEFYTISGQKSAGYPSRLASE